MRAHCSKCQLVFSLSLCSVSLEVGGRTYEHTWMSTMWSCGISRRPMRYGWGCFQRVPPRSSNVFFFPLAPPHQSYTCTRVMSADAQSLQKDRRHGCTFSSQIPVCQLCLSLRDKCPTKCYNFGALFNMYLYCHDLTSEHS